MNSENVNDQRQVFLQSLKVLCPDMPLEIALKVANGEVSCEVEEDVVVVTES